jgi:hypothetical protein
MSIPLQQLEKGRTYVVKMGETTVMTGTFEGLRTKRLVEPGSTHVWQVLVAQIVNDQKVGEYNDTYTFELAAAAEPPEAAAAAAGRRRRKSKKSKYRSRKTRRRHK